MKIKGQGEVYENKVVMLYDKDTVISSICENFLEFAIMVIRQPIAHHDYIARMKTKIRLQR